MKKSNIKIEQYEKYLDIGEGYRVPDISEFVQGFEFELYVEQTYGFAWIDFSQIDQSHMPKAEYTTYSEWVKREVDWMYDPNERVTFEHNGFTWDIEGECMNFFNKMHNLEELLRMNRIRVKVSECGNTER